LCVELRLVWAGVFEVWGWAGLGVVLPGLPWDDAAPGPLPDFVVEDPAWPVLLLRRVEAVRTGAGSATCRRRPGSTRVPEGMPFQRRN
jgi:hypothetical protein